MQSIWWNQIKKARVFIEQIAESVLAGKSVVINFPDYIPWPSEMHESAENILREKNPEYSLIELECPVDAPDQLMLERFCKRETRAKYRKSVGAAKFLAALPESTLHSSYVWVRISSDEVLKSWTAFASDYIQNTPKYKDKAAFIFETQGLKSISKTKGVKFIDWNDSVDSYDVYTFCAVYSSEVGVPAYLRPYLVELASNISKYDVELGQACINAGMAFMHDPFLTLQGIRDTYVRSDGKPFQLCFEGDKLSSLVWESQLRTVFSIIEKYRSFYVSRNAKSISACLPTTDRDGREVRELKEVELGIIIKLVGEGNLSISLNDYEQIDFLRKKRNDLAHLTPIEFDDIRRILSLQSTIEQ